jgi:hypothetical protein
LDSIVDWWKKVLAETEPYSLLKAMAIDHVHQARRAACGRTESGI